jgi:archaellum component FlaF (FlaF/FlaG flagellin family)
MVKTISRVLAVVILMGKRSRHTGINSGSYSVGISGTAVNFTKGSSVMKTSDFEILIAGSTIYNFSQFDRRSDNFCRLAVYLRNRGQLAKRKVLLS